jgi:hypothetical protein
MPSGKRGFTMHCAYCEREESKLTQCATCEFSVCSSCLPEHQTGKCLVQWHFAAGGTADVPRGNLETKAQRGRDN